MKFTRWIKDFRHWLPNYVKEIQVLKFEQVMLGCKGGERNIPKKTDNVLPELDVVKVPDGQHVH